MPGRRVVFVACSVDGFIAGPRDDLSFLDPGETQTVEDTFAPFFAGVGALLMGRRTFEVVSAMGGDWPYGETPVLVLTHRPLVPPVPTVNALSGDIRSAVAAAQHAAGPRDVYIDGGELIRGALDADLVDELVVTVVPRILGKGTALFSGATRRHDLQLLSHRSIGAGFVELRYRPAR